MKGGINSPCLICPYIDQIRNVLFQFYYDMLRNSKQLLTVRNNWNPLEYTNMEYMGRNWADSQSFVTKVLLK